MLGERYSGTVSYIAPQAAISATTVALEVALHSVPDNVIPKAACYLEIEVARKDAANSLPRDHYLTSGGSRTSMCSILIPALPARCLPDLGL